MNRKKLILKRTLALLLAGGMCLNSGDLSVFATKKDMVRYAQLIDLSTISCQSDIALYTMENGTVDLKDGNYEKWIDRIDIPDYGKTFYDTLVEYTDHDGIDDYLIDDSYFSTENATTYDFGVEGTDTLHTIPITRIEYDENTDINSEVNYVYKVMRSVYDSFLMDHPEVFWMSGTSWVYTLYTYDPSVGKGYYDIYFPTIIFEGSQILGSDMEYFDIREENYQTSGAIERDIDVRDTAISRILETNEVVNAKTDYETIKAFNAWLTQNNEYNTEVAAGNGIGAHYVHNCLSALKGDQGTTGPVCEAYAKAFKILCDKKNIPCIMVLGDAYVAPETTEPESHAWNNVKIDGNWYAADVTWNDPAVLNVDGALSGYENESYLLVGADTSIEGMKFSASHVVTNTASIGGVAFTNGPKLSSEHYTAENVHKHSYGSDWKNNEKQHWHECTSSDCNEKSGLADHEFEWKIDTPASEFVAGVKHEECKVCKYKRNENTTIPATHEHSYGSDWENDEKQHWHECTSSDCDEKNNVAAHTFEWKIDKKAVGIENGLKHEECTVCGAKRNENTVILAETKVDRISGSTRYDTSTAIADRLKERMGVEKFDTVIIASGENKREADALSGSYLAVVKNAPILLTSRNEKQIAKLHAYIRENLNKGGTIYILGGTVAIPDTVETIRNEGYIVERVKGSTRYGTSAAILETAGITGEEIIVATGKTFADCLSASATGRPILLVEFGKSLNDAQKAILEKINGGTIYIAGGTGAVSKATEEELTNYGKVVRMSGANRYGTSVEIAKQFFKDVNTAVISNGENAADGLCGGPLAASMGVPLILTKDGNTKDASGYLTDNEIQSGYVLGGSKALSDISVKELFE